MPLDTKQIAALSFCGFALLFVGAVLFAMFGPEGCGPSEDERQLLNTLNNLDTLRERGGQVKKITAIQNPNRTDNVYRYEAEILDYRSVPIGRLRGERVEGFATMRPRIMWYQTPGEREEWQEPARRGPGRRPQGMEGRPRGERPEGARRPPGMEGRPRGEGPEGRPRGEGPGGAPPPPPPTE